MILVQTFEWTSLKNSTVSAQVNDPIYFTLYVMWQWKVNNIVVRNKRRNYCESNNLSAFPGKMYQSHVFRLIGGSKGEGIRDLHPLSVQFLSVSCIFCQKSCLIIGFWPKSRGWRPRLGNPGSATDADDILGSWTDFGVNLLLTA